MRTALVTGANRGIGLEVCRQLARLGLPVVLTGRDDTAVQEAVAGLTADGLNVRGHVLDVASSASIDAFVAWLKAEGIHVDVLVNNAGVWTEFGVLDSDEAESRNAFEVNFFGPWRLCQALVPLMLEAGYGRVVNVSSGCGSFGEGLEGPAAYSISKAAMNGLTLKLAEQLKGDVKANCLCPGWVKTRMGGPKAEISVEEGADTVVWLATLPSDGPKGGYFRSRKPISW